MATSRALTSGQRIVLQRILGLMEFWRITPDELVQDGDMPSPQQAEAEVPRSYRHPVTGEVWNGVGTQPDWLRKALATEGYRVSELRVGGEPPQDA